ncbi:MAG: chromate efflux transporter, partial [Micrococcales bacterium]|nr:chromate efflux transporter [Micrococcales bacterium]
MTASAPDTDTASRGSAVEVFWAFLRLGVTSFGGPVAHLGYFRDDLVARRRWMTDKAYADLVALCQFLPGPASSQVGFAMGLHRAGTLGALAAFIAFTLPSAILMVAFAFGAALFEGVIGAGLLTGLKIVAVAIVAQAVWGMAKNLTPDARRASIAVVAAVVALLLAGSIGQVLAIVLGALAGLLLCRSVPTALGDTGLMRFPVSRTAGITTLVAFVVILLGMPILAALTGGGALTLFDTFYRAGALVFGGGHVVLPLLQAGVVETGWVSPEQFLAGYGAVQAMPGPLFTFSAYLGTLSSVGPGGVLGATIALVAIFLPGFLLLIGVLPFWNALRTRTWMQSLM